MVSSGYQIRLITHSLSGWQHCPTADKSSVSQSSRFVFSICCWFIEGLENGNIWWVTFIFGQNSLGSKSSHFSSSKETVEMNLTTFYAHFYILFGSFLGTVSNILWHFANWMLPRVMLPCFRPLLNVQKSRFTEVAWLLRTPTCTWLKHEVVREYRYFLSSRLAPVVSLDVSLWKGLLCVDVRCP